VSPPVRPEPPPPFGLDPLSLALMEEEDQRRRKLGLPTLGLTAQDLTIPGTQLPVEEPHEIPRFTTDDTRAPVAGPPVRRRIPLTTPTAVPSDILPRVKPLPTPPPIPQLVNAPPGAMQETETATALARAAGTMAPEPPPGLSVEEGKQWRAAWFAAHPMETSGRQLMHAVGEQEAPIARFLGAEDFANTMERAQQLRESVGGEPKAPAKFVAGAAVTAPVFEGAGRLVQPFTRLLTRAAIPVGTKLLGPTAGRVGAGLVGTAAHTAATFAGGSAALAAADAAGRGGDAADIAKAAGEGARAAMNLNDPVNLAQFLLSMGQGGAASLAAAREVPGRVARVSSRVAEGLDVPPPAGWPIPGAPAPALMDAIAHPEDLAAERQAAAAEEQQAMRERIRAGRPAGRIPGPPPASNLEAPAFTRRTGVTPEQMRRSLTPLIGEPRPPTPLPPTLEEPAFTRGPEGVSIERMQRRAGVPPEQIASLDRLRRRGDIYGQLGETGGVREEPKIPEAEGPARLPGPPVTAIGREYSELAPSWYSRLERSIQTSPFEKGTPAQWRAQVSSNVAKGEIAYRGLDTFLDRADPSKALTRDEMLRALGPLPIGEARGAFGPRNPQAEVEFERLKPQLVQQRTDLTARIEDWQKRTNEGLVARGEDPITPDEAAYIVNRLVEESQYNQDFSEQREIGWGAKRHWPDTAPEPAMVPSLAGRVWDAASNGYRISDIDIARSLAPIVKEFYENAHPLTERAEQLRHEMEPTQSGAVEPKWRQYTTTYAATAGEIGQPEQPGQRPSRHEPVKYQVALTGGVPKERADVIDQQQAMAEHTKVATQAIYEARLTGGAIRQAARAQAHHIEFERNPELEAAGKPPEIGHGEARGFADEMYDVTSEMQSSQSQAARGEPGALTRARLAAEKLIAGAQALPAPIRRSRTLQAAVKKLAIQAADLATLEQQRATLRWPDRPLPPVWKNEGHWGGTPDVLSWRRMEVAPLASGGDALHVTELQSDQGQHQQGVLPPEQANAGRTELTKIVDSYLARTDEGTHQLRTELAAIHNAVGRGSPLDENQMRRLVPTSGVQANIRLGQQSATEGAIDAERLGDYIGKAAAQRLLAEAGVADAPLEQIPGALEKLGMAPADAKRLGELLTPLIRTGNKPFVRIPMAKTEEWVGYQMRAAVQDAIDAGLHDVTWTPASEQRVRWHNALEQVLRRQAPNATAELTLYSYGEKPPGPGWTQQIGYGEQPVANAWERKSTFTAADLQSSPREYSVQYDQVMPKAIEDIGKKLKIPLRVDKTDLRIGGRLVPAWHVHLPDELVQRVQKLGLWVWESVPDWRRRPEIDDRMQAFGDREPVMPAALRASLLRDPVNPKALSLRGLHLDLAETPQGRTLSFRGRGTLAEALKPARDPRLEHFHTILVKDGNIVGFTHVTSGSDVTASPMRINPDGSVEEARWLEGLRSQVRRSGADGIIFAHNHPSGDPHPSWQDIAFTKQIREQLGRDLGVDVLGHIVIDHELAYWIDGPKAETSFNTAQELSRPQELAQLVTVHAKPYENDWTQATGMQVLHQGSIEQLARHVVDEGQLKPGTFAVVWLDSQARTVGVEYHRMPATRTIGTWLPQRLRAMAAHGAILMSGAHDVGQLASELQAIQEPRRYGTSREALAGAKLPIYDVLDADHPRMLTHWKGYEQTEMPANGFIPHEDALVPGPQPPSPAFKASDWTNTEKLEADPEGQQALSDQIEKVVEKYGAGALRKVRVPHAQTIAEAARAGIDLHGLDGDIVSDQARAHVLGAGQVIAANTARMVEAAKEANDPSIPAQRRLLASRQLALLGRQNDALLYGLIRSKSEGGRLLNSFKILARKTLDPGVWLQRAAQLWGRPIDPAEQAEIGRLLESRDLDGVARYVASRVRTPVGQQFRDLWRAGFLTNPTSIIVAATSDLSMTGLETVKDPLAVAADALMAPFTGRRTKGALGPIDLARAGARGALDGAKQFWRTMRGGRQQTNLLEHPPTQVDVFKWKPINAIANAYLHVVFNAYEAKTAFFRALTFRRSLMEQVDLAARQGGLRGVKLRDRIAAIDANLKGEPTAPAIPGFDQMVETAAHDAEVATFQDKTLAGTIASNITNPPWRPEHPIAKGTLEGYKFAATGVLPFTKTPGAIATRVVEYSPLGLGRGLGEMLRVALQGAKADPRLQRAAAEATARGLVGSFVIYLGWKLAEAGISTPAVQATTQQQKVARQSGETGSSLLIGADWRRVGRIAPVGALLAIGARLHELAENRQQGLGVGETLAQTGIGAMQSVSELPFMQGVTNVSEAVREQPTEEEPLGAKAKRFAMGYASGLVPAGVQAVHRGLHPEIRQPQNLAQAVTLGGPPVVSPVTGIVKRTGGVAEALFDPMKASADLRRTDPIVAQLTDAGYAVPRLQKIPGESAEQFAARQLKAVPAMRFALNAAIHLPEYQAAAAEEARALKDAGGNSAVAEQLLAARHLHDDSFKSRRQLLGEAASIVNRIFSGAQYLPQVELLRKYGP